MDRVSSSLRSTEITLRGIFAYAMKLAGECDSDTAAVARLGGEDGNDDGIDFNSTSSLPMLLKFQRLAFATKEDALSTRKAHEVLMRQRSSMEKDVRGFCSSIRRTLDVWMDEKRVGGGEGRGVGVSMLDIQEENQDLPTGRVEAKVTLVDPPSNELKSAEEIIRETRAISQKRLRSMHLNSPPKTKTETPRKKTITAPFPEKKNESVDFKFV